MNLYVRYFVHECLAKTIDEALDFVASIGEIKFDRNNAVSRITTFMESNNRYPYRLKVSYSNYVLFLKTEAQTLEEFKIEEQQRFAAQKEAAEAEHQGFSDRKKQLMEALQQKNEGWYEAKMTFKRVILVPETQKYKYFDTPFTVRCKAESAMDCYNRMVSYLKTREDIDQRSQFPSPRSLNFEYKFIGENVG